MVVQPDTVVHFQVTDARAAAYEIANEGKAQQDKAEVERDAAREEAQAESARSGTAAAEERQTESVRLSRAD